MSFPWWKYIEQNEQPPKQPRWVVMENCTGFNAGIPPAKSYFGCQHRVKGSSYSESRAVAVNRLSGRQYHDFAGVLFLNDSVAGGMCLLLILKLG